MKRSISQVSCNYFDRVKSYPIVKDIQYRPLIGGVASSAKTVKTPEFLTADKALVEKIRQDNSSNFSVKDISFNSDATFTLFEPKARVNGEDVPMGESYGVCKALGFAAISQVEPQGSVSENSFDNLAVVSFEGDSNSKQAAKRVNYVVCQLQK
jgi:hypothetical protein